MAIIDEVMSCTFKKKPLLFRIVYTKKFNQILWIGRCRKNRHLYIINMVECLIDSIFVIFGGQVFQQTVGMHLGTKCPPLLTDLCLYSYEADFIQVLLKKTEQKLARTSNFTFRYIDDVLSLNNSKFGEFADRIYPIELEIKDTTDTDISASYLDLHLEIDSEGLSRTKLYDK